MNRKRGIKVITEVILIIVSGSRKRSKELKSRGIPKAPIPKNIPNRLSLAVLSVSLMSDVREFVPPFIIPPPRPVVKRAILSSVIVSAVEMAKRPIAMSKMLKIRMNL